VSTFVLGNFDVNNASLYLLDQNVDHVNPVTGSRPEPTMSPTPPCLVTGTLAAPRTHAYGEAADGGDGGNAEQEAMVEETRVTRHTPRSLVPENFSSQHAAGAVVG
jgi:hypothetical protein